MTKLKESIYQDEEEIKIDIIETCEYDTYKSPNPYLPPSSQRNLKPDGFISSRSNETKKSIKKLNHKTNASRKQVNLKHKCFENISYNDENKENELNAFWDMKNIENDKITTKPLDKSNLNSENILKVVKNKVQNCSTFDVNRRKAKNFNVNQKCNNFSIDSKTFDTNSSSLNNETHIDPKKSLYNKHNINHLDFHNSKTTEDKAKCNLNIHALGQLQTQ